MARRRRPPRPGALAELPPLKILSQIAALQALYYAVALVLMLFTVLVAGSAFSMELIFGWDAVRGDTTQGWLMGFVWILDGGLVMAVAIVVLVGRSKLVLDFVLSVHAIHLVIVTLYTGQLPRHTAWWLSMAAASGVSVALATWGCRYRQLQPITFGGGGAASTAGGSGGDNGNAGESGLNGDVEEGFPRGRGRERGRDGAGEYEMAALSNDTGR